MRTVHCLYILGLFWALAVPKLALAQDPLKMSYYDVLGVSKNATSEQIKTARNEMAKIYLNDTSPEGHARMVAVNRAYSVLKDPDQRAAYDFESPQPPMTAAPSGHYTPDRMLMEIRNFLNNRSPHLTPDLLNEVQNLLLSRLGNPDFMVNDRQRAIFYRDLYDLIQVSHEKSSYAVVRCVVIVGLHLMLKRHDATGTQLFDELYVQWSERLRQNARHNLARLQEWLELAEILEFKNHRKIPLPYLKDDVCKGRLIDKQA